MTEVAVLGAGSWGSVLADLLARKGMSVRLWAYEPEVSDGINRQHRNPLFMCHATLHPSIRASSDLAAVVDGAGLICSAVPSHVTRPVLMAARPHVRADTPLVCATKGIEHDTLKLMHDVAAETLPDCRFAGLSGPSFAEEVYAGQPTAVVAASRDTALAIEVQGIFSTPAFRVYTHDDVIGVSVGGSLKNTIAIAAGILEGLGLGNNPRAALLTRGLAEMERLGIALGAQSCTFSGLAGMGDLLLTCTGSLSRNHQLGIALARGEHLAGYHAAHRTVAEGVNTARAASRLAEQHGVDMPITRQVAAVLFEGVSPQASIQTLMGRALKPERAR